MKSQYPEFVVKWHEMVEVIAAVFLFIAISIVLFYLIGLVLGKNRSKKYQYVSSKEISSLQGALLFTSLALAFYVNSLLTYAVKTANNTELTVQVLSSFVVGGIFWFVFKTIINIYYPSVLEKRLTNIRFKEFHHPETGNKMRLLNEDEEDVHLTEEMIKHENVFAYDYDVWLDEGTEEKIIEKYDVHHTFRVCGECKFRTLKEQKEEILIKPTKNTEGKIVQHFECSFCGHKEHHDVTVAPLD
ncbi:MAG: hypothetical protein JXQ96_14380 [Cyclobacteriaceae bacterium]